ncbi:hypothetical protein [Streptomyces sp. CA2R106]|uniref:hypothetical protein n=1 Tax=Streptomyces sp. CA2R106 TaxID=3120153 RepID=UPI00300B2B22
MTTTNRAARAGLAAAAAVAALSLALAACGTSPPSPDDPANPGSSAPPTTTEPNTPAEVYPTGTPGTPRGSSPAHFDQHDADGVARATLAVMYASDTRIDTGPHDAIVRATRYMTTKYSAELKGAPPHAAPGARWQQWTDHHAYTTATVTAADDAGRPADTPTAAYRQYTVSAVAHGDDGYTNTQQVGTAFVELTRATAGDVWRVAAVQIR